MRKPWGWWEYSAAGAGLGVTLFWAVLLLESHGPENAVKWISRVVLDPAWNYALALPGLGDSPLVAIIFAVVGSGLNAMVGALVGCVVRAMRVFRKSGRAASVEQPTPTDKRRDV